MTAADGRRAMEAAPAWRAHKVDDATLMLDRISGEVGRRKADPGSATLSLQRRERLLARVREIAAGIKARP